MPLNYRHVEYNPSDGIPNEALRVAVAIAVAGDRARRGEYKPVEAAMRLVDRSQTPYAVVVRGKGFLSHDGSFVPSVITADWFSPAEIHEAVKAVPNAVDVLISDCLLSLLPADYYRRKEASA
jgi:hypothetical protein